MGGLLAQLLQLQEQLPIEQARLGSEGRALRSVFQDGSGGGRLLRSRWWNRCGADALKQVRRQFPSVRSTTTVAGAVGRKFFQRFSRDGKSRSFFRDPHSIFYLRDGFRP